MEDYRIPAGAVVALKALGLSGFPQWRVGQGKTAFSIELELTWNIRQKDKRQKREDRKVAKKMSATPALQTLSTSTVTTPASKPSPRRVSPDVAFCTAKTPTALQPMETTHSPVVRSKDPPVPPPETTPKPTTSKKPSAPPKKKLRTSTPVKSKSPPRDLKKELRAKYHQDKAPDNYVRREHDSFDLKKYDVAKAFVDPPVTIDPDDDVHIFKLHRRPKPGQTISMDLPAYLSWRRNDVPIIWKGPNSKAFVEWHWDLFNELTTHCPELYDIPKGKNLDVLQASLKACSSWDKAWPSHLAPPDK